jgi:Holliday junction resolvasome RuvABC ATP-dependent DNA helicase subunit
MVNQKNVKDELEVRLRELDLITSSTRGRIVTDKGAKYLEKYTEEIDWETL